MDYTRLLRRGMRGADVKAVKDRLVQLCYLFAATHDLYGVDTQKAVRTYQAEHGLDADGIVGPLTWAALFGEAAASYEPDSIPDETVEPPAAAFDGDLPGQLSDAAAQAILADLGGVSELRRAIVLDALYYAIDPGDPGTYPLSLYIRGGNLYNADLTPNVITLSRIATGAARQPEYYDGGRREIMEAAVRANPTITGADCSGGVVGLMRKHGVYKPTFDAAANTLGGNGHSRAITRAALSPGDWLHKSGHIGLYAGGGYGVEWAGGAYGCQLTRVDKRRCYNYVDHRLHGMGAWTGFRRPTYYD